MAITQALYDQIVKEGGCVYGGGTKGQGNAMCRSAAVPGQKYCPRHLVILAGKAAGTTQRSTIPSR